MTQGSLPPATAEGTLETSPLAQVMAHALDKRLAGSLQLGAADGAEPTATIVLHDGWPYKARTSEPHYLGMALHTMGLIDDVTLNASLLRLSKEKRPHGQILLEMGALAPDDLMRGLRAQLSAKLEPLFALPPAMTFRFYEKVDLLPTWGGPEVPAVDPLSVLWPALLRSPPWPQVNAVLARIPASTPMRITPRFDLARFRFSKGTTELVELMRMSPVTMGEMPTTALVPENEARLLVYVMLLTKQIAFMAPDSVRRPTPAPFASQAAPAPEPPRVAPASVFPQARTMPPPKIGSVPPPRASGHPPARSAPPPGVALIPELAAFRQRIIERVATINDEDYFEVLGIPRGASAQIAQTAFLALAKTWHPDRLAPQLFDVKDLSVKVFSRMNDARATLTTSELREAYIQQLKRGVKPDRTGPVEETNAALEFQKAELFLKRRAFDQAEAHCRRAREADPANADYLALLTWISVERGGPMAPAENLHDAIEAMGIALKLNDRCERAYFYRGLLYKRINRPEKAHQDFKEVVEINPNHIDAARETHLYKKRSS